MKNVVKISISGLAFTLEEDGYILLDKYLNQLKKYYTKQQNGMEVVEGIEERIAELLRERMSTPEEVVSKELIEKVLAIMGKPEDIEGDTAGDETQAHDKEKGFETKPKRRIYRNMDNRVLGGVCSGIAAYFTIDPVILRLIFALLALFSGIGFGFFKHFWLPPFGFPVTGGWIFIIYIVLWIAVPAAKTVTQKCEMRGERPDFSGIQERVKRGAEQVERGVRNASRNISKNMEGTGAEMITAIGRVIAFCVGILLVLIAVPVLIALPVSLIFASSWMHGVLPHGLTTLVAFNGNILWIKLLASLVLLLPFVGILFGGISLIFRLRPQRVNPGLIIFVGWLLSLIALVIMVLLATRPYYGGIEKAREERSIEMRSDTLYVHYTTPLELPDKDIWMEAGSSEAFLCWIEGARQNLQAVVYPKIRIIRVDPLQPLRIQFIGMASGNYLEEASLRAEESIPGYTLQDSLLTLLPDIYSRQNKWQGNMGEALIYVPLGKEVLLTSPFRHHFDQNAPHISKGARWYNAHIGSTPSRWNHRAEHKWERWERKWERKWRRWERRWDN